MNLVCNIKNVTVAPLAAMTLASSLWLCLTASTAQASTITLSNRWVDLSSAPGFSPSGTYLARFGGFASSFEPNLQNLASWSANFAGGTGVYDMTTKSPWIQFNNANNALVTNGQALWLLVYNVAPSALDSTATAGVILRMNSWVAGAATQLVAGRRGGFVETTFNYDYWAGGARTIQAGRNLDEDNFTGPFDIQNFSSPTHTLALGDGNVTGYDIVVTSALQQPSTQAPLYTWTNGWGEKSLAAGWTNNASPTNGSTVIFSGGAGTVTNDEQVSSLASVSFSNTTGSITLAGSAFAVGTNGIANLSGNAHTVGNNILLAGDATFNAVSNNLTFAGNVNNADSRLMVDGAHNTSIEGAVSGAGGLTKTGSGKLVLSGANTYEGGTVIAAGTLQIGNGGTNGALGSGAVTNNAAMIFNRSDNTTVANLISGTGSVAKTGPGRLTMIGNNTYTGATTLEAGELNVNGSISNSAVTVQSGAYLTGSGWVGTTVVQAGGTHSPGNSPGVQTVVGNLSYESAATVLWELVANSTSGRGTNYDGIDVTGNLAFNGSTILSISFNTTGSGVNWSDAFWTTDKTGANGWLVFSVDGTVTGFENLSLSGLLLDSLGNSLASQRAGANFGLSQVNNDVYLTYTAVPEPSTYALLVLGAAALGTHLWRRRRCK
jgi:autotransporter-associated beta strand protein